MQEIRFETGICEYTVNGQGVLRFNPTDPGLYARYMDFYNRLEAQVNDYRALLEKKGEGSQGILKGATHIDRAVKQGLGEVFGTGNDFDQLLCGMNVMATTDTGATVLENLLDALLPLIEQSAKARQADMRDKADAAVEKAKARREKLEQ